MEQLILSLRERGTTILIISHNFDQVMRLSDKVVVMRAGRTVARRTTTETDGQELVALITGAIQDPHIAKPRSEPDGEVTDSPRDGQDSTRGRAETT